MDIFRLLLEQDSDDLFTDDLTDSSHIPLVVDTIENSFNGLYAAWPERLYIFEGKHIKFISTPDNAFLHEAANTFFQS